MQRVRNRPSVKVVASRCARGVALYGSRGGRCQSSPNPSRRCRGLVVVRGDSWTLPGLSSPFTAPPMRPTRFRRDRPTRRVCLFARVQLIQTCLASVFRRRSGFTGRVGRLESPVSSVDASGMSVVPWRVYRWCRPSCPATSSGCVSTRFESRRAPSFQPRLQLLVTVTVALVLPIILDVF